MDYKNKKIYYLKSTGEILHDSSYMYEIDVDFEKDYSVILELQKHEKNSVGLIFLEDNQYAQDFAECTSYRVNPETRQLEFSYEPIDDDNEQVYRAPLSEEVDILKQENVILTDYVLDMDYRLIMIELGGM